MGVVVCRGSGPVSVRRLYDRRAPGGAACVGAGFRAGRSGVPAHGDRRRERGRGRHGTERPKDELRAVDPERAPIFVQTDAVQPGYEGPDGRRLRRGGRNPVGLFRESGIRLRRRAAADQPSVPDQSQPPRKPVYRGVYGGGRAAG